MGQGYGFAVRAGLDFRRTKADEANVIIARLGTGTPLKQSLFGVLGQITGKNGDFLMAIKHHAAQLFAFQRDALDQGQGFALLFDFQLVGGAD